MKHLRGCSRIFVTSLLSFALVGFAAGCGGDKTSGGGSGSGEEDTGATGGDGTATATATAGDTEVDSGSGGTMDGGSDGATMDGGGDGTTSDGGTSQDGGTSGDGGTTQDGGTTSDGGTTQDGGTTSDGGTTQDGGTTSDGGTTQDGGTTSDGGTTLDGGTTGDGGTTLDGGTTGDGGTTSDGGTTGDVFDTGSDTVADTGTDTASDALSGDADAGACSGVNTCTSGDGCCPAGCSGSNDSDCANLSTVGGACSDASDCTTSSCSGGSLHNGYCTAGCQQDSDCAGRAHCGFQDQTGAGACLRSCSSDSDCPRSDYGCLDADNDGTNECWAVGSGSSSVGGTCSLIRDCSGGENATCFTESNGQFKGGYCSWRYCNASNTCPTGSHCSTFGSSSDGFCLEDCTNDSDCRTSGYACHDYNGDGTDECAPSGTGSKAVGDSCAGLWECSGGTDAACISNANFDGGYCSEGQCTQGSCPSGSHCAFTNDSTRGNFCVDSCTSDSDCRASGYACYDRDGDGSDECYSAGTGSQNIGDSCSSVAQCASGEFAICISSYPNGYCSELCGSGEGSCPSGSSCVQDVCLDDCISDADCRTGYSCTSGSCVPQ